MRGFAAEFFKTFLRSKGKYKKPEAKAFLRPYEVNGDEITTWTNNAWDGDMKDSIKFAVMDFCNIPKIINKETSSRDAPYFVDFLKKIKKLTDPAPTDLDVWLWICGDQDVDDDLRVEIRNGIFGSHYSTHYAEYIPAPVERLEDLAASSARAKAPVNLIFLMKKNVKIKPKAIPRMFGYSEIPKWLKMGLYNELDYRIYSTKLRMEMYLQVLHFFCNQRTKVFSVFSGGKFVCAAWVSCRCINFSFKLV